MKQIKQLYYLTHYIQSNTPQLFLPNPEKFITKHRPLYDQQHLEKRVNYYCKLNQQIPLSEHQTSIRNFRLVKPSAYFLDLKPYLIHFDKDYKFDYLFGDVIHVPDTPSIVKSRPIGENNSNSVLFKLNKRRHFMFVNDKIPFEKKKDLLIWRGNIFENQKSRYRFLERHFDNPRCDAGHLNDYADNRWQSTSLSIKKHLQYKFILSIEGNDVATNLKWIMSSNSLCFMVKPQYETWMMEGLLQPGIHYVELKDDYSDLDEKIDYYLEHPQEAKEIIQNANAHIGQFKDNKQEKLVSLMVLKKYFSYTNK